MTLQLAVRITGDASGLKQATEEATRAVQPLEAGLKGATGQLDAFAHSGDSATRAAAAVSSAQSQVNAAMLAAGGSLSASTNAHRAHGDAANLNRMQMLELGHVAKATIEQLAAGAPVMTILAQQGSSVAQALSMGQGGVAGSLTTVGQKLTGLVSGARLAVGGLATLAAGAVYLGVSWAKSQKEIEDGLQGIGQMSRATVGDINRIAEAASSGNLQSRGQARGIAAAIAGTGKIDVLNIQGVAELAPGYAKLFGTDIETAGQDLARIFSDPVKGAEELNQRIGSLDASTQAYIRTLVAQGQRQEAIRVTVRAFQPDLDAAAQKTTAWAKTWNAVASAAEVAAGFIAKPFTGGPLEAQIAQAQKTVDDLEYQRDSGTGFDAAGQLPGARKTLSNLLQKQSDQTAGSQQKIAADLSRSAEEAVRGLQPEIAAIDDLNTRIALLKQTQSSLDALSGLSAAARQRITETIEGAISASATLMTAQERARASEALNIRSIEARTVAERAAIAAEQERQSLAGKFVAGGDAERSRLAQAASNAVFAQSTRDSQDRLRNSTDNLAAAGLPTYQRQRAELEARYRQVFTTDKGNPDAIANDQKSRAADRQAIDREAIAAPIRDANRSIAEQVSALKLQQDAFGQSTEAAERMSAVMKLTNQFIAAGVPITADLTKQIGTYGAAAGKVAAAQEDLVRKQREVIGGLDDIRGGLRGGLTGVFSDVSQGKNPLDNIASSVSGIASRIFDRQVSTPLVNSLVGQDGKAGGGMFGDALGGVFGKAAGLQTASISAGIVNVSGPVSGLGSIASTAAGAANSNVPSATSVAAGLIGKTGTSSSDLDRYATAIKAVESSSGNYQALGPVTASGDRAYGAYQVMGANIPSWTKDALGKSLTKSEFLNDPAAQDAVFKKQFGDNVTKYGNADDAASVWFTGKPLAQGADLKDVLGTSGSSYVDKFNANLPAATPAAASVTVPLQSLDSSLKSVEQSATSSAQGVTSLTGNLSNLPGSLDQTAQGFTKVSGSIGQNGGGLLGALGSLFGGAGSSSTATVAAAGGGHIRGPGTSTSDSINARLSDGEFVVNAAATSRNLPLLHALNENRLPRFADGGLYPRAVPPAARWNASPAAQQNAGAGGGQPGVEFHLHNEVGAQVQTKQTTNDRGQPRVDTYLKRMVGAEASRTGSPMQRGLQSSFGLAPVLVRR